ncbi:xanthine dehydrogenase family protein molybdopterin-binding subunit [Conexibacter sp. JD483]|uniref:xanthine dehydrogenase family protein molybdopterin-binding subunit n=1 Tax=unclassified Conexibacter TaxID=2627773 RepID=UPI0027256987|nr:MULTISPECIES: xanthine dehydrogenase family protein molybdopterin-binding subunit [unclassified Conexibacter]MDO8189306.1 xanthine dehydrogenase family protein molybdopterin-binding subunit [Conexibacter sp. CPCC 205706]MDO8201988.1 xanthine dehydrogenase family protein molybdopterin-binding subunit [Conexibacter sp. CPCC 205762]MDR9372297.1 xanthine dehydrogenase family protein molybdopterin-binding subunit [Conexibacter sp. JD483]
MAREPLVGRSVPRVEDERLLRGNGRYVDDIAPAGCLEAAFLRSPHAHARIKAIDVSLARLMPGVHAIFTGADLHGQVEPMVFQIAKIVPPPVRESTGAWSRVHPMAALPTERATWVGQPLAVVIADDRYRAEDALELIELELEPLPAVVDPLDALAPGAPLLEPEWESNLALHYRFSNGDVDAVFDSAAVVVEEQFRSHRHIASPIETRGVVAQPDPYDGRLLVWSSTQTPHQLRDFLAGALRRSPETLHVRAPDVGGGFGPKGAIYPEELVISYVASALNTPVKWIEDRSEHFLATTHGREQVHTIALAADADGRFLALRDQITHNCGAFNILGLVVPYNSLTHLVGMYAIPAVDVEMRAVVTNTGVTAPYRGAGRPEAVFAMERIVDRVARRLGIDPGELRERNAIPPSALPYETGMIYRDGTRQVYDSGDYPELLRQARRLVSDEDWEARAGAGREVGIGYAAYVEGTGVGPFESASAQVIAGARVRVAVGSASQGQGHRTTLGQIAADALGVPLEAIEVVGGDTNAIATGFGTLASRSLVVGGNAVAKACAELRAQVVEAAAGLGFEVGADDPLPLGPMAALTPFNPGRPAGAPAVLRAQAEYYPGPVTYAAGVHAAVVAVDPRTGEVEILRYAIAHDCGRAVNPQIADGQVIGGTMQGIGGALFEELVYDDEGQLRTASFMDYLLPTASEMPEFRTAHVDVVSPLNPLGVKGLGEGGAIGPMAALANAVEGALAGHGVVVRSCPLTPDRVRALVRATEPPVPTAQETT